MTRLAILALAALLTGGSAPALLAGEQRDPRIASTSFAEVCATDGRPGSAYSRAHRIMWRRPVPGKILDHVVPICIGGADSDANIQLQTYDKAARKDEIERRVCIAVCRDRTMTLAQGQAIFLTGQWRKEMR